MRLDKAVIEDLADRLSQAEADRRQTGLFSCAYPALVAEDAYAIQSAWASARIRSGQKLIGHKIGLTSRAIQRACGVEEPAYGLLFADMLFADGEDIPFRRFIAPRVEVELAFHLQKPLQGPDCTISDVLAATDCIVPAIEIIDARIEPVDKASGVSRTVLDTISDNTACAGLVLGGRPIRPAAFDPRSVSGLLCRNGVIEDSGVSAAVLGHPARAVAWLADRLHLKGEKLAAGEIILAGSFTAAIPAVHGDSFDIDFGQFGSVSFRFA